jgi:hypothetical protein
MSFKDFLIEGTVNSDCRDDEGITVGLMDGIIAQIRILRDRKLDGKEVKEVFKDLAADEDFKWLCDKIGEQNG